MTGTPPAAPVVDVRLPRETATVPRGLLRITALAVVIAVGAACTAVLLTHLIGLITNAAFYGRFSTAFVSPANNRLGVWVIVVPIIGALIIGVMARFGSPAIRGHGIPEAMEQVLFNESRISPRLTILKPVSAAISIGTGGPFGAEGPIIATGGALGSLLSQLLHTTADERKVLLSAGAAAGMAATFGSPVAAVLIAIELLLFEYRARSLIPVAFAAATAAGVRIAFWGTAPVLSMPMIAQPSGVALAAYIVLGAIVGLVAVLVTRSVYAVEDLFEKLPIHWMWAPALGAIAVGVIGYIEPRTLGVGYENIEVALSGHLLGTALLSLVVLKFISWAIALGSGTSGGTMAPLFTIGGGLGALLTTATAAVAPALGLDPRIGALVGMAAMFTGASRALLASVVFAFEVTRQPLGLLPLLAGCSAAYLISLMLMRETIMTERLSRRGTRVQTDYAVDYLQQVMVRDRASMSVVALAAENSIGEVREWLASHGRGATHQGFPVIEENGDLVGVVTRRDLLDDETHPDTLVLEIVKRGPVVIYTDNTLREAADQMIVENVGRLAVVARDNPRRITGIITRSDLLHAHQRRLDAMHVVERSISFARRGENSKV